MRPAAFLATAWIINIRLIVLMIWWRATVDEDGHYSFAVAL
jgi:hypothetical protein